MSDFFALSSKNLTIVWNQQIHMESFCSLKCIRKWINNWSSLKEIINLKSNLWGHNETRSHCVSMWSIVSTSEGLQTKNLYLFLKRHLQNLFSSKKLLFAFTKHCLCLQVAVNRLLKTKLVPFKDLGTGFESRTNFTLPDK